MAEGSPHPTAGSDGRGAGATTAFAVVLGASNVTNGLPEIVEAARATLGPQLGLCVVHGHGRSFGIRSRVLVRSLPSIVEAGVWSHLDSLPRPPGHAVLTDVGNDIMYGQDPADILRWVETCVDRLRERGTALTVVGLPLARLERLGPTMYEVARMALFPRQRRLSFETALARIHEVADGVRGIASTRGCTWIEPPAAWYGLDPVHITRRRRQAAWSMILGAWTPSVTPPPVTTPPLDRLVRRLRLRGTLHQDVTILGRRVGGPAAPPGQAMFEDGTSVLIF